MSDRSGERMRFAWCLDCGEQELDRSIGLCLECGASDRPDELKEGWDESD